MMARARDTSPSPSQPAAGIGPSAFEWGLLGLLAAVFAPAIVALQGEWVRLDYYSHGYFVPLVALWAAAAHRECLRHLPRQPEGRGALLIAAAIVTYGVGSLFASVALQGLGLVAALAGALWWQRGIAWLRQLAFPIAFLLFMVPLPETLLAPTIVAMRLGVTNAGVGLLQGAGYSVYREGNVIELPGGDALFVAEACSGITSVITLIPIATVVAYFAEQRLGRRLALVLAVVPLALLGNLLRVLATVAVAASYGVHAATTGPLHEWTGFLTYALGCGALLGISALMHRWMPDARSLAP